MHVALRIAYHGQLFRGLARQPTGETVEDALAAALAGDGLVKGSLRIGSRTDAGVSAIANVVKAELDRPHLTGLIPSLQSRLAAGLWVTGAAEVTPEWHVRHATSRTYHYFSPRRGEDIGLLQAACTEFIGTHDFTAFARIENRAAVRPVTSMTVVQDDDAWRFEVTGPGFLWNQVRRMVHAALCVGRGQATASDIANGLKGGQVPGIFQVAPAQGLVLHTVEYQPAIAWNSAAGRLARGPLRRDRQAAEVQARVLRAVSDATT